MVPNFTQRRPRTLLALLFSSLALCACGGGGGASQDAGPGALPPSGAPVAEARTFSQITMPREFNWSTVKAVAAPSLVLHHGSSGAGMVRVVLSNFIEADPTGSGEPIAPMSTDVIATALASAESPTPVQVTLPDLRLPSATREVLVEVFAMAGSQRLAWRKVKLDDLAGGSVEIGM